MTNSQRQLWFRWVSANALGELFGLSLIFLIAEMVHLWCI
jgi:hypothetical protein